MPAATIAAALGQPAPDPNKRPYRNLIARFWPNIRQFVAEDFGSQMITAKRATADVAGSKTGTVKVIWIGDSANDGKDYEIPLGFSSDTFGAAGSISGGDDLIMLQLSDGSYLPIARIVHHP